MQVPLMIYSYADAMKIAQKHPGVGVKRHSNGSGFVLILNGEPFTPSSSADKQPLPENTDHVVIALRAEVSRLTKQLQSIRMEKEELVADITKLTTDKVELQKELQQCRGKPARTVPDPIYTDDKLRSAQRARDQCLSQLKSAKDQIATLAKENAELIQKLTAAESAQALLLSIKACMSEEEFTQLVTGARAISDHTVPAAEAGTSSLRPCTCKGERENCFRCYGSGVYAPVFE